MKEKYLPIGTICKIANNTKEVMIIGYLPKPNGTNIVYDYAVVTFPEGLINTELIFGLNHNQITGILFEGYTTDESINFRGLINNFVTENNIQITENSLPHNSNNLPSANNNQSQETMPIVPPVIPGLENPIETAIPNETLDL